MVRTKEQIIEEIDKLPEEIMKTMQRLDNIQKNREIVDKELSGMKYRLIQDIATELGEDGKPKFKNEDLRKAELDSRMKSSPKYVDLFNQGKDLQNKESYAVIEIDFFKNRMKSIEIQAKLWAGN